MASPADVNQLVTTVTANDYAKVVNIKQTIGKIYRTYIGIPNGFYSINLSDPNERKCFTALVSLSNTNASQRQNLKLGGPIFAFL